jgi:hypothetical protein
MGDVMLDLNKPLELSDGTPVTVKNNDHAGNWVSAFIEGHSESRSFGLDGIVLYPDEDLPHRWAVKGRTLRNKKEEEILIDTNKPLELSDGTPVYKVADGSGWVRVVLKAGQNRALGRDFLVTHGRPCVDHDKGYAWPVNGRTLRNKEEPLIDINKPLELSDGTPVYLHNACGKNTVNVTLNEGDSLTRTFMLDTGKQQIADDASMAWKVNGRTLRNKTTMSKIVLDANMKFPFVLKNKDGQKVTLVGFMSAQTCSAGYDRVIGFTNSYSGKLDTYYADDGRDAKGTNSRLELNPVTDVQRDYDKLSANDKAVLKLLRSDSISRNLKVAHNLIVDRTGNSDRAPAVWDYANDFNYV